MDPVFSKSDVYADLAAVKYSIPSETQYALAPREIEDLPIAPATREWGRHQWITICVSTERYATVRTVPLGTSRRNVVLGHIHTWHVEPLFIALRIVSCIHITLLKILTLLSHDIISP